VGRPLWGGGGGGPRGGGGRDGAGPGRAGVASGWAAACAGGPKRAPWAARAAPGAPLEWLSARAAGALPSHPAAPALLAPGSSTSTWTRSRRAPQTRRSVEDLSKGLRGDPTWTGQHELEGGAAAPAACLPPAQLCAGAGGPGAGAPPSCLGTHAALSIPAHAPAALFRSPASGGPARWAPCLIPRLVYRRLPRPQLHTRLPQRGERGRVSLVGVVRMRPSTRADKAVSLLHHRGLAGSQSVGSPLCGAQQRVGARGGGRERETACMFTPGAAAGATGICTRRES
jgi:hypothetical protein